MSVSDINLKNLNFDEFQKEAIERLKSGEALTGKSGILRPLIKQILEAALEGKIASHLQETKEEGLINRRNGKLKKTVKTGTESLC